MLQYYYFWIGNVFTVFVCVGRHPCTSMKSERKKWIIREDEFYMSGGTLCHSVSARWEWFGTSFTPRSPDQSHSCVCLCRSRRSTTKTCSTQLRSYIDLACRQCWMPLLLLSVFRLVFLFTLVLFFFPSAPFFLSYLATKSLPERFGLFWCLFLIDAAC